MWHLLECVCPSFYECAKTTTIFRIDDHLPNQLDSKEALTNISMKQKNFIVSNYLEWSRMYFIRRGAMSSL